MLSVGELHDSFSEQVTVPVCLASAERAQSLTGGVNAGGTTCF